MKELSIWEKAMGWRKRQMVESQLDNGVTYTGKHIGKEIAHRIDPPQPTRNEVIEEVAKEIEKMKAFGPDTIGSFAVYIRNMKT